LPAADPALIGRGEQLAKTGDATKGLQSCDNCHGPGGAGEPPAIPYLAGQYAHYTSFELQMWQRGFRKSSPEGMAVIARLLNDQDIAAVAAYFQQVRSAAPAVAQQKE
jgi:cytochrome c553